MADNVRYNEPDDGTPIATDDLGGGVHIQRVKPAFGADGSAADVTKTNPLPVAIAGVADATGMTPNRATVTATVATIKASSGRLHWLHASNPNTQTVFLQIFDALSGSITVGTTTPKWSIAIPPGDGSSIYGQVEFNAPLPAEFATGIAIACTTTPTGSTTPTTGANVNWGTV
jgi:hypothetical protein